MQELIFNLAFDTKVFWGMPPADVKPSVKMVSVFDE